MRNMFAVLLALVGVWMAVYGFTSAVDVAHAVTGLLAVLVAVLAVYDFEEG